MTATADTTAAHVDRWHHLLLRLSGRLPDGLLAEARTLLAHDMIDELAARVGTWIPALELTLAAADADLLRASGVPAEIEISEKDVLPPFGLAPVGPWALAAHGDRVPPYLDLTDGADPADELRETDTADRVMGAAAAALGGVRGVWRVWRYPTVDTPWARPCRMYLVEAAAGTPLPSTTLALQQALAAAGHSDPLVEAYADSQALPAFHRHARAYAALLWAASPHAPVTLARVFDGADPDTGPWFDPAHPRMPDGDERDRLLAYLDGGVPLLATGSLMADVVAPELGDLVPMTFRTDGRWIWTDAVAYYLLRHGLLPDPELLAWIRAANYALPDVDGVAVHRATAALHAA